MSHYNTQRVSHAAKNVYRILLLALFIANNVIGFETNVTDKALVIAIYFPQFHRDPTNDKLWGDGYTDWDRLRKSPEVNRFNDKILRPIDSLGYYDLLDKDTRRSQGEMAKKYGVDGFLYHTYWFYDGKDNPNPVLGGALIKMLQDGQPDMPFMLNWANEPWTSVWLGQHSVKMLKPQRYPNPKLDPKAILEHYNYLRKFFTHENYIKVHGSPAFMIYDCHDSASLSPLMAELVRLAQVMDSFPGLHFIFRQRRGPYTMHYKPHVDNTVPPIFAANNFYPGVPWSLKNRKLHPTSPFVPPSCLFHSQGGRRGIRSKNKIPEYHGVMTQYDNTPRRSAENATIFQPSKAGQQLAVNDPHGGGALGQLYSHKDSNEDEVSDGEGGKKGKREKLRSRAKHFNRNNQRKLQSRIGSNSFALNSNANPNLFGNAGYSTNKQNPSSSSASKNNLIQSNKGNMGSNSGLQGSSNGYNMPMNYNTNANNGYPSMGSSTTINAGQMSSNNGPGAGPMTMPPPSQQMGGSSVGGVNAMGIGRSSGPQNGGNIYNAGGGNNAYGNTRTAAGGIRMANNGGSMASGGSSTLGATASVGMNNLGSVVSGIGAADQPRGNHANNGGPFAMTNNPNSNALSQNPENVMRGQYVRNSYGNIIGRHSNGQLSSGGKGYPSEGNGQGANSAQESSQNVIQSITARDGQNQYQGQNLGQGHGHILGQQSQGQILGQQSQGQILVQQSQGQNLVQGQGKNQGQLVDDKGSNKVTPAAGSSTPSLTQSLSTTNNLKRSSNEDSSNESKRNTRPNSRGSSGSTTSNATPNRSALRSSNSASSKTTGNLSGSSGGGGAKKSANAGSNLDKEEKSESRIEHKESKLQTKSKSAEVDPSETSDDEELEQVKERRERRKRNKEPGDLREYEEISYAAVPPLSVLNSRSKYPPVSPAAQTFEEDLLKMMYVERCCQSIEARSKGGRFVMINAWNEWGEGMVLEPSNVFGFEFLESLQRARELAQHDDCAPEPDVIHRS